MASFAINYISGWPTYATRNRGQTLIPANQETSLWSVQAPNVNETPTGSINCCTFSMPTAQAPMIRIGMEVQINGIQTGTQFTIIGTLRGHIFLQSATITMPRSGTAMPVVNFQVFAEAQRFPCRIAGDWSWSINITGVPPINFPTTTRLEICLVASAPPQAPLNPGTPNTIARPNFGGEYPIDAFRLFLPTPEELTGILQNALPNYLVRSMSVIWNLGLALNPELNATRLFSYETINGAPSYIDGYLGGLFQLRRFARGLFDSLNCYDLAGLTQIAACIIQDNQGNELLDPRWIYCTPYGFINSGPLFGWPQYPACNSPFFGQGKLPYYPPNDPQRNSFGNHAWIEVVIQAGQQPVVLDATHCLQAAPNAPASGTQDRPTYLASQTDPTRGPYDWLYTSNPASRTSMIGLNGFGTTPFALTELEPGEIDVESDLVNNAPCDPRSLLQLVNGLLPNAYIDLDDYVVGSKGCQALLVFCGIVSDDDRLTLEITNARSERIAIHGFQNLREQILNGIPEDFILDSSDLGENSVRLPSSVAWLRNSTRIRIIVPAKYLQDDPQYAELLLQLAKRIDDYITSNAVPPQKQHLPGVTLTGPKTVIVSIHDTFSLNLGSLGDNLPYAELSSPAIVQCLGPISDANEFKFLAIAPGEVVIKLCVAHRGSLAVQILYVKATVKNKVVSQSKALLFGHKHTVQANKCSSSDE
ncbi:hypothetical protein TWF706_000768 [Orbilia oligospora]|nr:hypothetical protein TWF706_000768 [Orbilia oligospora]